jgi:hypothetical protein
MRDQLRRLRVLILAPFTTIPDATASSRHADGFSAVKIVC